jgi:hypothetical protein
MKTHRLTVLLFALILAVGLTTVGCSGKNKLLEEISGQWQDSQNHSVVDIHLFGDEKSVTVGGQPYPVDIEKIEMINYLVQLKVTSSAAEPESWTIKEIWEENGASFKLSFKHNGISEVLVPKGQS